MTDYAPNTTVPGSVYQVIRLLGQGGMGTVYEVEDTTVGKRYVLKTLHAELRDRREIAERINKEARILARLSHPNIVDVVTAGVTEDSLRLPYFVMQKLDGHTLRSVLIAKGRLPTQTAYSIAIDLLDALDHAHSMGVIHRDVKPENIFLHRGPSDAHQTKLLDFGVMHLLSGEESNAEARFVGTLRYAPPEQLSGGPITRQTDLYATALVLYEMLAGSGPFDDQTTDREIANAHLERAPPRLSSCIEISPELDELVMSALSKDPEERPRDAFSFAAKLRELSRAAISERLAMAAILSGIATPKASTNLEYPAPIHAPQAIRRPADGDEFAKTDRDPRTVTTAPIRRNATTMGATSSPAPPAARVSRAVVFAVACFAILVLGIVLGEWNRGRIAAASKATSLDPAAGVSTRASTTGSTTMRLRTAATASASGVPAASTPTGATAGPTAVTPPASAASAHASSPRRQGSSVEPTR